MIHVEYRTQHNPEYHKLLDELEAKYPSKRFVAICDGKECGNDDDFDRLLRSLDQLGIPRDRSHIVQVGNEAPDYVELFFPYAIDPTA